MEGIILKALSGFYYVDDGSGRLTACRGRGKLRRQKVTPLVGDRVLGMERRGTQLECFPVLEGKELIDAAKTLLTEGGEQRTLTQEEKKEHFIR